MIPREFAFCLDINYAYIRTWRGRHLKETGLWDNITWSEIIRHLLISNNNRELKNHDEVHDDDVC